MLAASVPVDEDGRSLTASMGVVVTGDGSDTSEALLHDADTARYEANHALDGTGAVLFRTTAHGRQRQVGSRSRPGRAGLAVG